MTEFHEQMRARDDERDREDRAQEAYCERVERLQEIRAAERSVTAHSNLTPARAESTRETVVGAVGDVALGCVGHRDQAPGAETPSVPSPLAYRELI